jgi:serine/threonine protein kinase
MTGIDLFDPLETGDTNVIRRAVLECDSNGIDLSAILDPQCQHLVSQMLKYNPSDRISMDEILGHPWLQI